MATHDRIRTGSLPGRSGTLYPLSYTGGGCERTCTVILSVRSGALWLVELRSRGSVQESNLGPALPKCGSYHWNNGSVDLGPESNRQPLDYETNTLPLSYPEGDASRSRTWTCMTRACNPTIRTTRRWTQPESNRRPSAQNAGCSPLHHGSGSPDPIRTDISRLQRPVCFPDYTTGPVITVGFEPTWANARGS